MNVILHGEGKEIRMHRTDTDQVMHQLTVPVKVFSGGNKWTQPVVTDLDRVYKFTYHDGFYSHYQLEPHHELKKGISSIHPSARCGK